MASFEASRILYRLGSGVHVFNLNGLPLKDDVQHCHAKG